MKTDELELCNQNLVLQRCVCGFVAESYVSDQEMCSGKVALFANADATTNFVLQRHLAEAHKAIL